MLRRFVLTFVLIIAAVSFVTAQDSSGVTFDKGYLEGIQKNIKTRDLGWEAGVTSFFNLNFADILAVMAEATKPVESSGDGISYDTATYKFGDLNSASEDFMTYSKQGGIPDSFSLLDYMPDMEDQGYYQDCTSYAMSAALEGSARTQLDLPTSDEYGFAFRTPSAADLFYSSQGPVRWYSKLSIDTAVDFASNIGVLPHRFDDWIINDSNKSIGVTKFTEMRTKIAGTVIKMYSKRQLDYLTANGFWDKPISENDDYKDIGAVKFQIFSSDEDLQDKVIKYWLVLNGPVLATIVIPDNGDLYFYREGVYTPSGEFSTTSVIHTVTIIGYDEAKKAWLCRNSWGENWGISGNFWIEYNKCSIDSSVWGIANFDRIYLQFDPNNP